MLHTINTQPSRMGGIYGQNGQYDHKWSKNVKNIGKKGHKLSKRSTMVKNGQQWSKTVNNGQYGQKQSKSVRKKSCVRKALNLSIDTHSITIAIKIIMIMSCDLAKGCKLSEQKPEKKILSELHFAKSASGRPCLKTAGK